MASVSEPVIFREFCPLYSLLNAIPTKIQKGFRSVVVYLTALDTNGDYIAVGSSIGMLYLYCRHFNQMRKYNFEGKTESITVVKLLSCFDDLVAAGTASGRVAVFQLVSSLPGRNKQLRRFDVSGIHKNSITALAWSPNGMKLFSGDDRGKIVYSSLDLDQEGWVLSWNEYSIYLLDTVNQATIAGLEGSGDIVSVSCTENEIFFLKGDRNIIRISSKPEGLASIVRDGLDTSGCSERAQAQHVEKPAGATTSEPRLRGSSVASSAASEPRSRSSSLNSTDSGSGLHTAELGKGSQPSSQRFSVISSEDFDQELVVKPIKVKKKRRRKKTEGGTRSTHHSSLESTPCSEFPADSPQSLNTDLLSMSPSVLGSSVDPLSTDSPDQESSLSGEVNGVLRENNDPEAFSILEVPETAPDFLAEQNDVRANIPQCDRIHEVEALNGGLDLPLLSREDMEGSDVTGLGEEPLPMDDELNSEHLSFQEQNGPAEALILEPHASQGTFSEAPLPGPLMEPSSLFGSPGAEQGLPATRVDEGSTKEPGKEQDTLSNTGAPCHLGSSPWHAVVEDDTGQKETSTSGCDVGSMRGQLPPVVSALVASTHKPWLEQPSQDQALMSSDEEDIYAHGLPSSSSETSVTELGASHSLQDLSQPGVDATGLLKSDQFAESWMGYSGPGYGILSLAVSEKYIWCLDYKGGLFCSALPGAGLRWQKFEDAVQQVAVSPSGALLWKIEQKSNRAFACGKVTIKGKRHWYEALPQAVFVALSDDTAWIIRTNGDLYLQTGLSVDRPCARAVRVDCPYPLAQVTARNSVVWALTEQRALLYREGVSSFCPEGEQWTCDIISERQALEPVCITLGDQQTLWALDTHGKLWFRTGITAKRPQGDDDHWWQVSITDYVVFDQCSLFQTIIHATHSVATVAQAPVEKVADKLRMAFWSQQLQCQPSLLGVNNSGVWISSGKNEFHVAKGSLIGTYWKNVVPRGTASATKWAFVLASAAPTKEGSSLWLCQSSKDLCSISTQSAQCRPSTVQLPPDAEMRAYAACQDALWALDSLGQVFIRTLSKSCPTGMHWTRLDLSQLGAVKLTSLACGNQHIWACDSRGGVYFRVGTQPLNPSLMLPAWIMIEPPVQPAGVTLVSVHSSPNDQMLWALDSRWNVHVRVGITEEMPVGTDWEHVPGLQACQLALSTRTVWARCPNGDLARRYGITDKNPAGDYWKKIPGNMACVTVTSSDELWAVGPPGCLLQRLTKTFSHSHGAQKSGQAAAPHPEELEEEWEVI
ncbi:tectonin beta-propeller repeat-containing protein 2 isoform X7 [Lepus europaeus]|uniref:tectonin beta-propeller repeat-containing protein 2 isoform X7 n=1 Tax=Lepus europaeus TaxID=9983 RepID=UPI002B47DAC4|nr:tectonin beta-propeller repeat-containing protein 2 isoform X7 [Lepus europaeus]